MGVGVVGSAVGRIFDIIEYRIALPMVAFSEKFNYPH